VRSSFGEYGDSLNRLTS